MLSNQFLLKDAQGLELEIERHCVGLGLDVSDEYQVLVYVREMLQNMEQLKDAADKGDYTARAKIELFSMVVMLHEANAKAYGADYLKHIGALTKHETVWVAIAKAMWSELEARNLDEE